jgi:hypothetical protein
MKAPVVLHPQISRLDEDGPKSPSLADVREYMTKIFDDLKAVFDANTRPGFFFFCEDAIYVIDLNPDFSPGKRAGEAVCWKFVHDFAKNHGAYAVAVVTEQWGASKSWPNDPSDDPQRREAYGVYMRVRDGNACWRRSCFYERRNAMIAWAETIEGRVDSCNIPVWWDGARGDAGN